MMNFRQTDPPRPSPSPNVTLQAIVLLNVFFMASIRWGGTRIASIQATPRTKERIMKLQFGKKQLVLELSPSPFAWFHGQTERMSLTSLSLLFVQFSLFARQPVA